ncbi:response regulator transcription factor [Pseudomonas panipatensis]|uniref:Two-component system, OmpR family, response regulator/two-component system, OmpR family, response regulator PhoP/two-component system, OmpR family, response regulator QseB n=1 Tax=Pseudomonas panipatensis TaxID=428992 RepID=A0A1G8IJ49_9PSED|nr:response regulator transcription factor [Pseudomonas panipatensis]SDI18852.1 two-component system, OmpR family, response regulator/two-component system, OmpR family, response regulator PhoP/two-component system, OmpR family, response regulator QseB [Pseudomonas panipatensis]SMP73796.1 two component transcriptional regulator, winged helix family [Pseudomonas panipatensis]
MKALVVEDNALLGKSVKRGLQEAGWIVDLAVDGEEALYLVEASQYDVVLLDWMLPKRSGLDFIRHLRADANDIPIIMMTAKGDLADRVEGLERGADDYLVKPFEMAELIARVNALYRRAAGRGTSSLEVGALKIDLSGARVTRAGEPLELTGKEYDLLVALASKPGQLLTRNALIGLLYPFDTEPDSNSLDVFLARLRRKLIGSGAEIETLRGKGFILRVR